MMNPITKKAYKTEFETSNISLEDLLEKYNITKEELGSTSSWKKRVEVLPDNTYKRKDIIKPDITPSPETVEPVLDENFLDIIQDIKKLALASTKQFFENYNTDEVTTKEFKDMVVVLRDLESGELIRQGKNTGPTVNILIQNLTEKFQDDC